MFTLIVEVPDSPCNPIPNANSPFWSRKDGSSPGTVHEVAPIPSDANFPLIVLPTDNKYSILQLPRLAIAPNIYEKLNNKIDLKSIRY